jgi:cation:H+ antiporter
VSLSRATATIALTALLPLQWLALQFLVPGLSHEWQALSAGIGIFGAAFLLSWAAETGQVDVPEALALAFLALIAVLPEYAVDMYFAYRAGSDPAYTSFATANMTGANRLLIGLGWPAVVVASWLASGRRQIELDRSQTLELACLAVATVYAFVLAWKGSIDLIDAAVLLALFTAYMVAAARSTRGEVELEGLPEALATHLGTAARRAVVGGLFVLSGVAIYTAAEPFAEGLLAIGRRFAIEEFVLVQWLAPLASESPEFIVAIIFAWHGKPNAGMRALVSSKVNQWTLLIGMLPIAYAIGGGGGTGMHLDRRQVEEILLTAAQSLFALVVLANFRFSLLEAGMLAVLFITQLVITDEWARTVYAFAYLVLALAWGLARADNRRGIVDIVRLGAGASGQDRTP